MSQHRRRCLRLLCFAAAVCALVPLSGCRLIQLFPAADKAPPARPDAQAKNDKGEPKGIELATARTTEANPALPPSKSQLRVSQYVFCADFEIQREAPPFKALFKELADLRDQVHKTLLLPSSTTLVQVYLFEDRDRYERFMEANYPDLPKRRAFFIAQPRPIGGEELLVYAYWGNGERVQQDLRHELTHALLHSVLKDVPLWLDEGLAEYFEVAPGLGGVNAEHLRHLRQGPAGPARLDLARLEQLKQVEQMTPAEYRESWAWVHLMLHTSEDSRKVLTGYLRDLRSSKAPGALRTRLANTFPAPEMALERHLMMLEANRLH
jgi:hypothetical protein